jgi:hypothetical protein
MLQGLWTPREGVMLGDELVGYDVDGRDGKIGKVDHVAYERTCLIVSTSRLFARQYVIPANSVERVEKDSERLAVDLTKEEVENSPAYDDDVGFDDDCEAAAGAYYAEVLANRASIR